MDINIIQKPLSKVLIRKLKAVFTAIYENEPCTINLIANKCSMKPDTAKELVLWLTENKLVTQYKGKNIPPKSKSHKFYSISGRLFSAVVTKTSEDTDIQLYCYKDKSMHPIVFKVPDRSLHRGDTFKDQCLSDLRTFFKECFPRNKIIGAVFITDEAESREQNSIHVIDAVIEKEIPYRYITRREIIVSKCLARFTENKVILADLTESTCEVFSSDGRGPIKPPKTKKLLEDGKVNEKLFGELINTLNKEYLYEFAFFRVPCIYEGALRKITEELNIKGNKLYVYPKTALNVRALAAISLFSPTLTDERASSNKLLNMASVNLLKDMDCKSFDEETDNTVF